MRRCNCVGLFVNYFRLYPLVGPCVSLRGHSPLSNERRRIWLEFSHIRLGKLYSERTIDVKLQLKRLAAIRCLH